MTTWHICWFCFRLFRHSQCRFRHPGKHQVSQEVKILCIHVNELDAAALFFRVGDLPLKCDHGLAVFVQNTEINNRVCWWRANRHVNITAAKANIARGTARHRHIIKYNCRFHGRDPTRVLTTFAAAESSHNYPRALCNDTRLLIWLPTTVYRLQFMVYLHPDLQNGLHYTTCLNYSSGTPVA